MTSALSKDWDQPGHLSSLISPHEEALGPWLSLDWSDWVDSQAVFAGCTSFCWFCNASSHMDRVKRIWYLSPMRAAKVQASLRIRAVSPEPSLLAHTSSESRGTFRQKARSMAPLNGWTYAVKICNDGMLEDTNSLDGAHMVITNLTYCSVRRLLAIT